MTSTLDDYHSGDVRILKPHYTSELKCSKVRTDTILCTILSEEEMKVQQ